MARVLPPQTDSQDPVASSVLAHQPALLEAFTRLYGTLWSHGVVEQPLKEMARLRNARVTDCSFCRSVRFAGPREQGLTEDLVDRIADGHADGDLDARQKAVLALTDAMLQDAREPDAALREALLAHFSAEEIVELTAGIALFLGFSKIAVSLGPLPKDLPLMVMPTPDH